MKKMRPATFGSVLVHSGTTVISACDGTQTLAHLPRVISAYVDRDYKKFDLDFSQEETQETRVDVYRVINDATFEQMFGLPSSGLDALCLTQHQIKTFCENSRAPLGEPELSASTSFLFKTEDQFFVLLVMAHSCGLFLRPYKLNHNQVWRSVHNLRLVVPASLLR